MKEKKKHKKPEEPISPQAEIGFRYPVFHRIDQEHRLVYRVKHQRIDFLMARYHYQE